MATITITDVAGTSGIIESDTADEAFDQLREWFSDAPEEHREETLEGVEDLRSAYINGRPYGGLEVYLGVKIS